MDKIENVINGFLEPYFADGCIQAAVLTGSYAIGNQNKHSDIDIFIISSDELNWRERGNKVISDYLLEYFINPPKIILQEIVEYDGIATALIIANGKELFDKTGIIKTLKEKASEKINKTIIPISNYEKEMLKYYTYYYYDQLSRAYENNGDEFMYLYYIFLEHIMYSFGKYNGIILPPKAKTYQYIFDEKYNIHKTLKKMSDNGFINKLKKCMRKNDNEIMYKNITELKEYFMDSMGGFNIDGWKIRTEMK